MLTIYLLIEMHGKAVRIKESWYVQSDMGKAHCRFFAYPGVMSARRNI